MIFQWFFWKLLKLAFLISFLLTFLLFILQITRIDRIILQLPLHESAPFMFLWFFYYLCYMLPMSFFISYSILLFELKESKKLYLFQSFGIDTKSFYTKSLVPIFPLFVALLLSFIMLGEEDISHVRRQLTIKYYALIITSIPPKSFHTFGQFTFYVENRREGDLEGVFFKFQEGVVIAKRARVEEEHITFEKGSLLTQREDRTFSTDFNTYRLSLHMVMEREKELPVERYVVGSLNLLLSLLFMGFVHLPLWLIEQHHKFYYAVGLLSLLYQATLFFIRQSL
ncbi:MAG: LptF/LptG family permease [Aquificaceae bacterium]|nr:LptF/LptG family permease [Aquificaceae bacterium]